MKTEDGAVYGVARSFACDRDGFYWSIRALVPGDGPRDGIGFSIFRPRFLKQEERSKFCKDLKRARSEAKVYFYKK